MLARRLARYHLMLIRDSHFIASAFDASVVLSRYAFHNLRLFVAATSLTASSFSFLLAAMPMMPCQSC